MSLDSENRFKHKKSYKQIYLYICFMFSYRRSVLAYFLSFFIILFTVGISKSDAHNYRDAQLPQGFHVQTNVNHASNSIGSSPSTLLLINGEQQTRSISKIKLERTRRKVLETSPDIYFIPSFGFFFFSSIVIHLPLSSSLSQASVTNSLIRGPPSAGI
jgi:hypothetical protein